MVTFINHLVHCRRCTVQTCYTEGGIYHHEPPGFLFWLIWTVRPTMAFARKEGAHIRAAFAFVIWIFPSFKQDHGLGGNMGSKFAGRVALG